MGFGHNIFDKYDSTTAAVPLLLLLV